MRLGIRDSVPVICAVFILVATFVGLKKSIFGFLPQHPRNVISTEAFSKPDREPVVITNIKVGPTDVEFNKEFDAADEWIKDVSFKVKNHSIKNVTFVGVELFFPDTASTGPPMVRQLRFGQRPGIPNPKDGTLLLEPGQAIDVTMPTQYESLKKFLELRQRASSIKKLMVRVYLVFFEDGTKWDLGNYYVPDPSKPSGFRMVDTKPGIVSNNQ